MTYYVYQLIDSRNNMVFYVGYGQKNRMYQHEKDVQNGRIPNGSNKKLGNKIKKILSIGKTIESEKIFITENRQAALNKEKKLIAEIGLKNLCNLTSGGEGYKHSEETKRKMSKSKKGKHRSKETIEKIKESKCKNPYKHNIETKRKMSIVHKGKTYNEIYGKNAQSEIEKRRASMKGRKLTKEHKEKLSKAMKGHPPTKGFSGRKHKLESRRKISEKTKGENNPRFLIYIICSPENDEFQFRGRKEMIDFFRQYNIDNKLRGKEKISSHNLLKNRKNKGWKVIKSIKK